jgi:hypothetical protein
MGVSGAFFAAEKAGDIMKRVPYPVEESAQCTIFVNCLSIDGKEKKMSFNIDREIADAFRTDGRKATLLLLEENPEIFKQLSKNLVPIKFFLERLGLSILESDPRAKKFQVNLADSELKVLDVSVKTQSKSDFTKDFMTLFEDLLIRLSVEEVKESGDKLALSRYLEERYGVAVVFGAGTVMGGARMKFRVKPGSGKEDSPTDLIYEMSDGLVKSIENRISKVEDETLRISLFSMLETSVSLKSIPALACISKFLDAIEGDEIKAKSMMELAVALKSSFYATVPTLKKSYGIDAEFMLSSPYSVPATALTYARETATTGSKYGVSFYPDENGGNLAVILGLQDLYFSWDLVNVPEFTNFGKANLNPLHSGMLMYGGLGLGFEDDVPFLSLQAYRIDLSISKSGVEIEKIGLKVPGLYLGILMGISAVSTAITYKSADFWEYTAEAVMIDAFNTLNPYGPIDRLFTVLDLMMPEWAKDDVGMADFFERKKRVESYISSGEYNNALQEIESMLDSSEKSVTKDPIAKYIIMILEDRAIDMEIVHFGSSSPSKSIQKRSRDALKRIAELNEKAGKAFSKLNEKEWREYIGLTTYLSSKFLISFDQSKGIYFRTPSGFEPKEYESLALELSMASENISLHLLGSIQYSTVYSDDPMLSLGLATLKEISRAINPTMFGKYADALAKTNSKEINRDYLEFCLELFSGYGKVYSVQESDSRLWTALQTLKDGSNLLLEEENSADMEQKIKNSPVEFFFRTSDPSVFYQTEYWMPITSIYLWSKEDKKMDGLINSDEKVTMLARAEKRILQRLCKVLEKDISSYEMEFDFVPEELSSFDFSGEMTDKDIVKEILELEEVYPEFTEKYPENVKKIRDVSENIKSAKENLDSAVKELNLDPSSRDSRKKVAEALEMIDLQILMLESLLSEQVKLLNLQVARAKYVFKNDDDLDSLEDIGDQALDDFSSFSESKMGFEEMRGKVIRLAGLSVAMKKIDSALISESVPKKRNGKSED